MGKDTAGRAEAEGSVIDVHLTASAVKWLDDDAWMDLSTVTGQPASSRGIGANLRRGGPRIRRDSCHPAAYQLRYYYLMTCLAPIRHPPLRRIRLLRAAADNGSLPNKTKKVQIFRNKPCRAAGGRARRQRGVSPARPGHVFNERHRAGVPWRPGTVTGTRHMAESMWKYMQTYAVDQVPDWFFAASVAILPEGRHLIASVADHRLPSAHKRLAEAPSMA